MTPQSKKTALLEITFDGSIMIVKPAGPNVGQREAPIMKADIDPVVKSAGKAMKVMVMDLSSVQFMSSMGLGMIIDMRNAAAQSGATAVLFGVNKELKALLAMMKIEKLYKIADTAAQLQAICGR
ncbi:MAG: anti-sigma factor antagonist [Planctomycetota bacterium]|nr:MAG: anti-sigma factor antagonist [Planctomycetota bacterium]